jgi:hypothetical protein
MKKFAGKSAIFAGGGMELGYNSVYAIKSSSACLLITIKPLG